ncbi:tyrosine--tRNA ligase [Dermatophilus congolensis]|uniref:tyrosine--tRNA ligase n=1 Tax=Dermatophilus congolensis TaxID=1863 RepID=UPI001AAF36FA|nr:tyrosine--tRNA ligase [Dermatophilus congolensis]MBO3132408.1 tyrosine--tRNA ligase [Dermatophilus congolensis]MBO3133431.1 tyrosine--tRNA ligase [Dermatophilus congolensis]MBO3135666.1 tyrosine--tRNA ligase [Dermatophilus congolensis]MBO3137905.1 tyrosine--tRNA ligase [Dermatophilus congolensis]
MTHVLDELEWRGLIHATTDVEKLREELSTPTTVYCGFDPTAPSLHFGNLVQLVVLRIFQRHGHHVIALVGGSTGLIGDPRPTSERILKTKEQTAEWVERLKAQMRPFLDFEGDNPARMVNNLDWTEGLSALDFLRDFGKHFRVNHMVKKDAVAARLNSQEGISYTEFSYQILQAMDFRFLYKEYGCTVQTGGSDQWGNLTAGADLVSRMDGGQVHAVVTPILTDSSGEKFGKSAGNAVWLDPAMTSPYAFYQYWLNVEDASVIKLLKVFGSRDAAQVEALERAVAEEPFRRAAQKALAHDVTLLVHGEKAVSDVEAASAALFGGASLADLDAQTLVDATSELPSATVVAGAEVVDLLVATKLSESRKSARRTIGEGGVSINNVKVLDPAAVLREEDFLGGKVAVLKRGRKNMAAVYRES